MSQDSPDRAPGETPADPASGGRRGGPRGGRRGTSTATSLSPSRAADFQQCPLLYRFRTIDRLPEPPSAAATRGTLVHSVLEQVFDLPADQRTPASAQGLLAPAWERLLAAEPGLAALFGPLDGEAVTPSGSDGASGGAGAGDAVGTGDAVGPERADAACGTGGTDGASDRRGGAGVRADGRAGGRRGEVVDQEAWLRQAAALVQRWFTLEEPARLEPAERELYVQATLDGGLVLRGYVDRLDVSPDGLVRVVDYKTGRSPGEGFEGKALFQMRFYALVLWRARRVVPAMLQLVYLGDGQVVRYSPDVAELEATERKVLALWEAISGARASGDWRPRRSRLCGWCSFQDLCPEWGGTPPPLPPGARTLPVATA